MNIWIMRHGEAGFNAPSDNMRTLTDYGKQCACKQGEKLGKKFINQQITLDKIIVSPYTRTQQTLEGLLHGIQAVSSVQSFANSLKDIVEIWDGITPMGDCDNVQAYLDFLHEEGAKNILLISHLPLVYDLVQQLTNNQGRVSFQPAVIAEVEYNGKNGVLKTSYLPDNRNA